MRKQKKKSGAFLIEFAAVIVPFMFFFIGSLELLWFVNIKFALNDASEAALRYYAQFPHPKDREEALPNAKNAARNALKEMGFSESFANNVTVDIGTYPYITKKYFPGNVTNPPIWNYNNQCIAAVASIPISQATITPISITNLTKITGLGYTDIQAVSFFWKHFDF